MFFGKEERKARHPWLTLTVGALAAVGAMSIVSGVKCKVKCVIRGIIHPKKKDCMTDNDN